MCYQGTQAFRSKNFRRIQLFLPRVAQASGALLTVQLQTEVLLCNRKQKSTAFAS
jgi:hypothetical protein